VLCHVRLPGTHDELARAAAIFVQEAIDGPLHVIDNMYGAKILGGGQGVPHELLPPSRIVAQSVDCLAKRARVSLFDKLGTVVLLEPSAQEAARRTVGKYRSSG
jgi:hypothetical protein